MDRLDASAVERACGRLDAIPALGIRLALGPLLERLAHARRELGSRLLGEGDHDQRVHLGTTRCQQLDNSADERGRLPRAGARLHA